MNLLTISDGFGDSVAVPQWYPEYIKWPDIIKLMTSGVNLTNLSRYGAGNEYIVNCLRNNLDDKNLVLVQWAAPNRLDLLLGHSKPYQEFWDDAIGNDPIYKDNIVEIGLEKFWITSNSTSAPVIEYHQKYITNAQHQMRSQIFIDYAKLAIEQNSIEYRFLLTTDSEYLSNTVSNDIRWTWHHPWHGMHSFRFRSDFKDLDLGLMQPIPLIHFDFIKKFIMPEINLPWRSTAEIDAVENMLYKTYKESVQNKPIGVQ